VDREFDSARMVMTLISYMYVKDQSED